MRLSIPLALSGFAVDQALAACPYAEQLATRSELHGARDLPDSHRPAIGMRAEGKSGVFYMLVFPHSLLYGGSTCPIIVYEEFRASHNHVRFAL